ncbi:hypothetical protein GLIP_1296 [Aliiglaciecola lipolytica E3]|uniref:Uncharacterized protein n=1 Tax=Aliiglaciecola lipolytica E3 TaxID=1127673 RepID=K6Y6U4_9ALTE|nr:hypothetical protein GLIP_1296 [Aliiglaciecola lipolytica E3]
MSYNKPSLLKEICYFSWWASVITGTTVNRVKLNLAQLTDTTVTCC